MRSVGSEGSLEEGDAEGARLRDDAAVENSRAKAEIR